MKCVSSLRDLEQFGIVPLTGEACGLMYRVLCDLTEQGKRIVEKCLDVEISSEAWNQGTEKHVAAVMISNEMTRPLAIFAFLESGYSECFLSEGAVVAFDSDDRPEFIEMWKNAHTLGRRFSYGGTAGSRNRHEFTGRVT